MLISSSAMSPNGESPRTAANDTFQNKQCTIRFQMTGESNYSIVIATLCDWLKKLMLVFQPMTRKAKPQSHLVRAIFPAL